MYAVIPRRKQGENAIIFLHIKNRIASSGRNDLANVREVSSAVNAESTSDFNAKVRGTKELRYRV